MKHQKRHHHHQPYNRNHDHTCFIVGVVVPVVFSFVVYEWEGDCCLGSFCVLLELVSINSSPPLSLTHPLEPALQVCCYINFAPHYDEEEFIPPATSQSVSSASPSQSASHPSISSHLSSLIHTFFFFYFEVVMSTLMRFLCLKPLCESLLNTHTYIPAYICTFSVCVYFVGVKMGFVC